MDNDIFDIEPKSTAKKEASGHEIEEKEKEKNEIQIEEEKKKNNFDEKKISKKKKKKLKFKKSTLVFQLLQMAFRIHWVPRWWTVKKMRRCLLKMKKKKKDFEKINQNNSNDVHHLNTHSIEKDVVPKVEEPTKTQENKVEEPPKPQENKVEEPIKPEEEKRSQGEILEKKTPDNTPPKPKPGSIFQKKREEVGSPSKSPEEQKQQEENLEGLKFRVQQIHKPAVEQPKPVSDSLAMFKNRLNKKLEQSSSTSSNSTSSNSIPSNSTPSNTAPSNSAPSNSTPTNSTPISTPSNSTPTKSTDFLKKLEEKKKRNINQSSCSREKGFWKRF